MAAVICNGQEKATVTLKELHWQLLEDITMAWLAVKMSDMRTANYCISTHCSAT
jgi:hypothetical protein